MALSSLNGLPSAAPYFCHGPTDKGASGEFAIQQLISVFWQIWMAPGTSQFPVFISASYLFLITGTYSVGGHEAWKVQQKPRVVR